MRLSRFTRLFLLIAAFAAFVQWTIPHGWMVGSGGMGSALLVPCPSASPQLARFGVRSDRASEGHHMGSHAGMHASAHGAIDHDGGDGEGHGAAQSQCDFAALGAPVLPPDAPVLAFLLFTTNDLLVAFPAAAPGRGLAAPPPPSTGPPVSKA